MNRCIASFGGVRAVMLGTMRSLVVGLCLWALPAFADPPSLPLPTVTGTKIHIVTSQSRMYSNNLIWGGTHLGPTYNYGLQPGTWTEIDARPWFDSTFETNGIGIFVSGIVIITNPSSTEAADIHVTFARPSDTTAACGTIDQYGAAYIFQASLGSMGGVRSNAAAMIPVENGKFKACYTVSTSGNYYDTPPHASYGLNFTPQFWVE